MNKPAQRHYGFTMIELLLSLAISSVVLAAAAALAFAVSRAWAGSEDINTVVVHGRNGMFQASDRIRGARAIGYSSADTLLLWRQDANGDGLVNESELSVLMYRDGRLIEGRYVFGPGVTQAVMDANNALVTRDEFISAGIVARLQGNQFYQTGPLAEGVVSLTWRLDQSPPQTRMVQVHLRVSHAGLTQALVSGMALRAPLEVR